MEIIHLNQRTLAMRWDVSEAIVHVDDFEYAGQRYKSLSRIAMIITGTNRNGWTFFGPQTPPHH
jgi:hypothetical protein